MSRTTRSLNDVVEQYRQELEARTFESAEVKAAKLALLDYLVQFDESVGAPPRSQQIAEKLLVLDRIQFGRGTGEDLSNSLSNLRSGVNVEFKQSSFIKNFIDGLLKLLGFQPYTHFDDVIEAAKLALQEGQRIELEKTPLVHSAAQIAELPTLSSASLATHHKATSEEALRDFDGGTAIRDTRFSPEEHFMEAEYRQKIANAVNDLTATLDGRITSDERIIPVDANAEEPFAEGSFGREVWHVKSQDVAGSMRDALYAEIPSLMPPAAADFGTISRNWGVDEEGLYLDCKMILRSVTDSAGNTTLADENGELRRAEEGETTQRKLSGRPIPPIMEIEGRVRYTRNADGVIVPHTSSFQVTNPHSDVFPYSELARGFIRANTATATAAATDRAGGPPWTREAGHGHSATAAAAAEEDDSFSDDGRSDNGDDLDEDDDDGTRYHS